MLLRGQNHAPPKVGSMQESYSPKNGRPTNYYIVGARDHQFPSTYLLSVKKEKDESLTDYIIRFRKEIVIVENCTDAVAVTAIMAGLRP